jgi:hypothetical protein
MMMKSRSVALYKMPKILDWLIQFLLGQKIWNDDDIKKRRFVQNAQNIGLGDTIFEELVSDKSFIETCNFLRSHAIRLDQ